MGCRGGINTVHVTAVGDHAQMPKTLVLTAALPLCTTYCARMWSNTRCHKHPCLRRPCPKHWYLQQFCFFVQHTAQGCKARHVVTSIHAFGDHAKHWHLQRFCLFVQHTVQVVEQDDCHKRIKPWPASAGSVRPDKISFGVCTKTLPPPGF